jgi:hypothetical protein
VPQQPEDLVRLGRRVSWSFEDWVVAWDACPKRNQRYGQSDRNVREIAYLLNRTPSAVSHSFGNLWYPWSKGRHGARNGSHFCAEVVALYRTDPKAFHKLALDSRRRLVKQSIAPRVELQEEGGRGTLTLDLSRTISKESGVPRRAFIIYNRPGSVVDGIVLDLSVLGAGLLAGIGYGIGSRLVKFVEGLIRQGRSGSRVVIERNSTWIAIRDGDEERAEHLVIGRYLPALASAHLPPDQRRRLAAYLSMLMGVHSHPIKGNAGAVTQPSGPSKARQKQIEGRVGGSLGGLTDQAWMQIDQLLLAIESKGFRKSVRRGRTRRSIRSKKRSSRARRRRSK